MCVRVHAFVCARACVRTESNDICIYVLCRQSEFCTVHCIQELRGKEKLKKKTKLDRVYKQGRHNLD